MNCALIGMYMSSDKPNYSDVVRERADKTRAKQAKAETEFHNVVNKWEKFLRQRCKAEMIEKMEHDLRSYVWTYFETCNNWPPSLDPSDPPPEKIVATKDVAAKTSQPKRRATAKVVLEPSDFTAKLTQLFNDFDRDWSTDDGLDERPREELIKCEIMANIRMESKSVAEETVGKELEQLKKAHAREMGK